jgi:hypothetical protein
MAVGQDTPRWHGIDCSHSRVVVPAGLKCSTIDRFISSVTYRGPAAQG